MAGLDEPTVGTVTWPAIGAGATLRPGPGRGRLPGAEPAAAADRRGERRAAAGPRRRRRRRGARRRARTRSSCSACSSSRDKLPEEISGGQAQRVAVARALAGPAALILADEPTGQLDRASGAAVVDVLLAAAAHAGAALVVSTHDPTVAGGSRTPGSCTAAGSPPTVEGGGMVALTWLRGLLAHRRTRLRRDRARRRRRRRAARLDRDLPVLDDVEDDPAGDQPRRRRLAGRGASPAPTRPTCSATVRRQPGVTPRAPGLLRAHHRPRRPPPAARPSRPAPAGCSACPTATRRAFPGEIRVLAGSGTGVLLAQQTAANLHARPGDTITIGRPGGRPRHGQGRRRRRPARPPTRCSRRSARRSAPSRRRRRTTSCCCPQRDLRRASSAARPVTTQVHAGSSTALPGQPERRLHPGLGQRPQPRDAARRRRPGRRQPRHRARQRAQGRAVRAAAVPVPRRARRDPRRPGHRLDRRGRRRPPPPRRGAAAHPRRVDAPARPRRAGRDRARRRRSASPSGSAAALLIGAAAFGTASFGASTLAAVLWARRRGARRPDRSPPARSRCPPGATPAR